MKLNEALKRKRFGYTSIHHPKYIVHDDNPDVLILDRDYYKNKNGEGILAFNLHYLTDADVKKMVKVIQKYDNTIVDIKGIKRFIKSVFNVGHYPDSVAKKKERYKKLVAKFPMLLKVIRHYKKRTMS